MPVALPVGLGHSGDLVANPCSVSLVAGGLRDALWCRFVADASGPYRRPRRAAADQGQDIRPHAGKRSGPNQSAFRVVFLCRQLPAGNAGSWKSIALAHVQHSGAREVTARPHGLRAPPRPRPASQHG